MMSVFCLPSGLVDEIHSLLARFWWGSNGVDRKMHWHSWDALCFPKSMGGLGFRDLHCFNQALLAKQAWRLCQDNTSFLHLVLKARYYKGVDFLEARRGYNPSFTWRSIWGSKSLLLEGLKWCVGNGESIKVWDEAWILGEGAAVVPTPKEDSDMQLRVCELIDSAGGGWNIDAVRQTFIEDEWGAILNIPLSQFGPPDHRYWWPSRHGIFSVKSCYWLGKLGHVRAWRLQYGDQETPLWKDVWRVQGPPKLTHFLWRACKGSLGVMERLHRRHIRETAVCPICDDTSETIFHSLFQCKYAQAAWQVSPFRYIIDNLPVSSFEEAFSWLKKSCSCDELRTICAILWAVWFCRNQQIFENKILDAPSVAGNFVKLVADYCSYATSVFRPMGGLQGSNQSWTKPPAGVLKANFDAHINPNGEVGLGVVFRSSDGGVRMMGVRRLVAQWDAITAEAMAARYAVELSLRFNYDRVIFEGDALMVIGAVKRQGGGASPLYHVFNDIHRLCLGLDFVSFSHVKRAGNAVAHLLARWQCEHNSELVWFGSFPQSIDTLVELDLI